VGGRPSPAPPPPDRTQRPQEHCYRAWVRDRLGRSWAPIVSATTEEGAREKLGHLYEAGALEHLEYLHSYLEHADE
jgi:hypothetical protein